MTQQEIIKRYLESLGTWKREYEIHRISTPFGFIGPRGDRDVRHMVAHGLLEARMEGKYRAVRAKRSPLLEKFEALARPKVEMANKLF